MAFVFGPPRIKVLDLEIVFGGKYNKETVTAVTRWFFDLPTVHQTLYRETFEAYLEFLKVKADLAKELEV